MRDPTSSRLLLISQAYVPNPTSVGQHLADVAERMSQRGWDVLVLTASRAYDDPGVRFSRQETINGVNVRRLPFSSFGKQSIALRLLAQSLFMLQAVVYGLLTQKLTAVLVSTSPPFAGFGGAVISRLRRVPFLWWIMDLNPDQMVAAGKARPASFAVRVFNWMNRVTLQRASRIVVLDNFMAERLARKGVLPGKVRVIPMWPLIEPLAEGGDAIHHIAQAGRVFKKTHGLETRFVVMYSGNHGIQHPLATLLDAADALAQDQTLAFVFVGGGSGKKAIDQRIAAGARNLFSLPYQPLETLKDSLGAADLHVVSMDSAAVGIIHPSKIYGAIAVAKPVLFFGPLQSPIGILLERNRIGWRVEHGDVKGAVAAIREAAAMNTEDRLAMGVAGAEIARSVFSRRDLPSNICDLIEDIVNSQHPLPSSDSRDHS